MPRYLVERAIPGADELSASELRAIAQQSLRAQQWLEADIQWIQSVITGDQMVCLYIAYNEEIVRDHARLSGLPIRRISRVSAVIGPASDILG